MKIKKGFMLRSVANKHIVVAIGQASVEFNGLINLNETGAFLWEELSKGCTRDELLASLLENYEVDEETAKTAIDEFIAKANEAKLIDED